MEMIVTNMAIGMADTTIEHFKFNIVISNFTSVYPDWSMFLSIFLNAPCDFFIFIVLKWGKFSIFCGQSGIHMFF
jgi:hypothetical protein